MAGGRQRDNHGHVRALVPLPWTQSEGEREPDSTPDRGRDNPGDREAYSTPDSVILDAGLAAAIARAERAENQADEANKRADVAVALADRTLAELAEANARADRAEQAIATERTRADRAERDLAAERARADRADLARDRIEVAQAQVEATAEELREAVRKADHNRTAAEAIADEAVRAAEELRGHKPPGQGWGAGPELGRRGGGSEKGVAAEADRLCGDMVVAGAVTLRKAEKSWIKCRQGRCGSAPTHVAHKRPAPDEQGRCLHERSP
jgi:hypothetical protein